jgi:hypothetical protein
MTSTRRPRWLSVLRSPFLWVPFLLALVFHPGIPLTMLLWTDFAAVREHALRNSLRARTVEAGVLEVDYEVVVMMPMYGRDTDDWKRHCTLRLAELPSTSHDLGAAELTVDPRVTVYRPQGMLPVYDTGPAGSAWVFPDEECIVLRDGAHWKRVNERVGERARTVTVDLGLWRESSPPWMGVVRVVGTPVCLAADLFGLPRIVMALVGWGRAMRRIH